MKRFIGKLVASAVAALTIGASGAGYADGHSQSTWERVRSTGEIKFAVFKLSALLRQGQGDRRMGRAPSSRWPGTWPRR